MKVTFTKDLTELKTLARAKIDSEAEAFRLQFITNGTGQAMAYQEKYEEALLVASGNIISDSDIPHILAEVGITAPTKEDVAQVVLNLQSIWKGISAKIEKARLTAKDAVDAAKSAAEINSAALVDWPSVLG